MGTENKESLEGAPSFVDILFGNIVVVIVYWQARINSEIGSCVLTLQFSKQCGENTSLFVIYRRLGIVVFVLMFNTFSRHSGISPPACLLPVTARLAV